MTSQRYSIADFLTDGSVAALADALSQLAGGPGRITVRDERGRRIVQTQGEPPWAVIEPQTREALEEAADVRTALEHAADLSATLSEHRRLVVPLHVAGRPSGAIVIEPPEGPAESIDDGRWGAMQTVVEVVASTINEFCEHEVLLRHRNTGLALLNKLSSLLVGQRDLGQILDTAIRSAIELLEADAGTVHLLDADEERLELKAYVGIPDRLAARLAEQAVPGLPDASAMKGRVVISPDVRTPADEALRAAYTEEGLVASLSGGLSFKGQSVGLMRLYTKHARPFSDEEQAMLRTIAELVSAAVAGARLIEAEQHARSIKRQLELAGDIQRRLIPAKPPEFPQLDIAARYNPSFDVGGDFYDLIPLNGHLGVAIGDVVGKGVPAALLMTAVRASLRAHAQQLYHLHEVITRVNQDLTRDTLANEFATLFYGVIDPKTLRLTYCNAGHDPPLLARQKPATGISMPGLGKAGGYVCELESLTAGGMAVGIDEAQKYDRAIVHLKPGDTLVAYTDGVVDAMNFENKKFGRPRLIDALRWILTTDPEAPAQMIADHIIWEVRRFIGLKPETDDTSLVVIRVRRR
ncbi:MAG: SpoIIE family protein phosphatase [Phycisphaerales bacterium]|nr:SpoIIE family protein phosphatase [Phycisphaerales bacterium]